MSRQSNFAGSSKKKLRKAYGENWREHYTPVLIVDIIERDGLQCYLCGKETALECKSRHDPLRLSMDHIVSLGNKGTHCHENLRIACSICNSIKGLLENEETAKTYKGAKK